MRIAHNQETGERMIDVNGQWLPVEKTAVNQDGAEAYFAGGEWHVGEPTMPTLPQQQGAQPATQTEAPSYGWRRPRLSMRAGDVDPLVTMGTAAVAEPIAGIAGAAQLRSGRGIDAAANTVRSAREAMTYMPRSPEGQQTLQSIGQWLGPVAEAIEGVEKRLGDIGYDLAGPTGGMLGEILPTATLELLGLGMARQAKNTARTVNNVSNAAPDPKAQEIINAGERFDVPVLTTDVKPPSTYMGKWGQSFSEKLGPLGSGTVRKSQQAAREEAIIAFADQFDIDIDSPFADDVVRSLNAKAAKDLERAGAQRKRAVAKLDPYGDLPMQRTRAEIQKQIDHQNSLGKRADKTLIKTLEDTRDSLAGNFTHVKNMRSRVIKDVRAAGRGDDTSAQGPLQAVKSAMDKDMMAFARSNDRQAAADWIRSNRAFAEAYTTQKDTEIRRILNQGDATPEKVIPILRGGKPSELNRLYKSLTPKGQEAARRAIIQDALKDAGFFEVDYKANPDRLATALNRPNRQQAIRVFFRGDAKSEIDGLTRLLQATRRAQEGGAMVKTGEQAVLLLAGAGGGVASVVAPEVVIPAVTIGSAIAKAYESNRFRNLMIRLGNTQAGSKAETGLLEQAATFVVAELQAAKEAQEQTPLNTQ